MNEQAWEAIATAAAEITHGCPGALERWRKAMPLLDPASWQDLPVPEREWALDGWIPARQATYLTGPGSAGKSLLTQQLCTCIALGLPFMGVETRQAVALYLTCEDDEDELHRRQKAICEGLGVPMAALTGKLFLVSLAGQTETELATFGHAIERDEYGNTSPIMRTTSQWDALSGTVKALGAGFVGLDNVAHLFAGNENVRHEVASFVNLLNRLAIQIDGSVLFIGHPNKAGDSFSGSTAWENQVRSRLFLETPKDGDGTVLDSDARVLSRQKSNYARNGERLEFRWLQWAFVRAEDLPADMAREIALNAQAAAENAAFMRCLAAATERKRAVSHNPGSNYAPKVFAAMPEGKSVNERGYRAALERLLHLGQIALDQPLWRGPNRVMKQGIKAAEICTDPPAPTPCTDPHETRTNAARFNPPLSYGYNGRGLEAAAPDPDDVMWDDDEGRGD